MSLMLLYLIVGKTSTFKMVTGDEAISSGEAYVARYSVKTNIKDVRMWTL